MCVCVCYVCVRFGGHVVFRACDDRVDDCVCVCVFRAADGKPATSRTGSTVMRCLEAVGILIPSAPGGTFCALRCNASRQRIRLGKKIK